MGWITSVRCQKFRCEFVAQTFALIAPVQPISHRVSCSNETIQIATNTTKRTNSWVSRPMGWIGCVHCEKLWCDLVAQTSSLIALVQSVLHQVSCSNKTNPKCTETLRNKPILEFRVQWGGSGAFVAKNSMRLNGTNLSINCTSSTHFAPSSV